MQIPSNIILSSQYTAGNEFIYASSYLPYQGYYYELNNKFFVGKTFNTSAPELLKLNSNNLNPLLTQSSTFTYGKLSKEKITQTEVKSFPFNPTNKDFEQGFQIRYFAKKLNTTPFFIQEINKEDFKNLQTNPLYQILEIEYKFDYSETDLLLFDQKMPGLKEYLSDDFIVTSSEEDGK